MRIENPFFTCGAILHFSVCKPFPVVCLFQWTPSFKERGERPLGGDIQGDRTQTVTSNLDLTEIVMEPGL